MKTPRELLLQRHQAVVPKLDRVRAEVLSAELRPGTAPNPVLALALTAWREVLWPSPLAWAGLACVWLVTLTLHVASREPSNPAIAKLQSLPPKVLVALVERPRTGGI